MGRRFRQAKAKSGWKYWYRGRGGVSGGSRIVPHRYMDEGDNGPAHRREIRRRESRFWRRDQDHIEDWE